MQHTDDQLDTFTQKDLMKHLLNVSQHAATREELSSVRDDLMSVSQKAATREELGSVRDELTAAIGQCATKDEVRTLIQALELRMTLKLGSVVVACTTFLALLIKFL